MSQITQQLASELQAKPHQIQGAVALLDEGATVPFIARYRKEATGGLDDTQLRQLAERLTYLRELEERRSYILTQVTEQGKLTKNLKDQILNAVSKQSLEDLFLPFKPKRRTKAVIAREAGLQDLAEKLWRHPSMDPQQAAANYLNPAAGFNDSAEVLEGCQAIFAEHWSEDAGLLAKLRNRLNREGVWSSKVTKQGKTDGDHYRDYFDHQEAFRRIPSHRALAMFRGAKEGMLRLDIQFPATAKDRLPQGEAIIRHHLRFEHRRRAADDWLAETIRQAWKSKIHGQLKTQLSQQLREQAEVEAIEVFAKNLKDLLLASPAGAQVTMGLDPGYRTGVKVVVVNATGKILSQAVIFPHAPQNKWDQSLHILQKLCTAHAVSLISIGNGTASRETERLVDALKKQHPQLNIQPVVISEAGASVYSASALAAKELPDMDVSYRGAVSIARRLQDPLAELVKIDPKAIGVGQYQHDLAAGKLNKRLAEVVEDCVNAVGVFLNTASAPLLTHVSGLNAGLAQSIVTYREKNGPFQDRKALLKVPRLGPKAFEQAAGFLRIRNGTHPLDASGVHPESYGIASLFARDLHCNLTQLIAQPQRLKTLNLETYLSKQTGMPTLLDIVKELEKPGRDPRPQFKTAQFATDVETMEDLREGMILEGVVRNVANFGAFVDIGVHQDGLVHISAMANHFIKDPRDVVHTGQIVKVKVVSVEPQRKRIALTMRLED